MSYQNEERIQNAIDEARVLARSSWQIALLVAGLVSVYIVLSCLYRLTAAVEEIAGSLP